MKKASKVTAPVRASFRSGTRKNGSVSISVQDTSGEKRKYDPEQTKRNIIEIATAEFAAMGLGGARVDAIAERTSTTKRMLYYYFGSKEGLYEAVIEEAYGKIRALEQALRLDTMAPRDALRLLVEFTFDFHDTQRDFVQLIAGENISGGKHAEHLHAFKARNSSVVKTIRDLIERGTAENVFRHGIDPFDLHLMISSLCFFRISNRHTFAMAFGRDPAGPRSRSRHRAMIVDAVLRFVAC
ncbi:TetR family transcriptional regulator [Burkholderia sp. Leaf177]|uniref:TetR family transcriptional regulator n=1 Tax=Burkholderia sp. Leaf177 TaxID=1736287 RepID=UPI0009EC97F3